MKLECPNCHHENPEKIDHKNKSEKREEMIKKIISSLR